MSNKTIILSGYTSNSGESFPADKYIEGSNNILTELEHPIEEADLRIIRHIQHAIKQGNLRVIATSNNTDGVVLLIHYYKVFQSINELWIYYRTGEKARYIPMHCLNSVIEEAAASSLLVSHMLTGCDITSKVGTKVFAYTFVTLKFTRFRSSFNYNQYSRRSLSQTLKGPAKKFEIAKVRDNKKIPKTNYEKVRSYYPSSTRHRVDVERLILIKEKSKLI